jgi:hypothetical protein
LATLHEIERGGDRALGRVLQGDGKTEIGGAAVSADLAQVPGMGFDGGGRLPVHVLLEGGEFLGIEALEQLG